MSKFIPERSNLNIPGAWNPAIITANWLKKEFPELLPADNYEAELTPGPTPSIRFIVEGVVLSSGNGKLILSPIDDNRKRVEYIEELSLQIFRKLPHTPIGAVGHNFVYSLEEDESFAVEEFTNDDKRNDFYSSMKLEMSCSKNQHTFAYDNHILNAIYDSSGEQPFIQLNFHYGANDKPKVETAIKQFVKNRLKAEKLVEALVRR